MNYRRPIALLFPVLLGGCSMPYAQQPQFGMDPATGHPWVAALTAAQRAGAAGEFDRADSVLLAYSERHASAPEAAEAHYWRGVFLLDPTNAKGSPALAAQAFGTYLQARTPMVHHAQALTLRRVATRLDSLERAMLGERTPTPGGARPAAVGTGATRDDEVARLRDELRRSNEELERIRRRLATPRPDEQPAAPQPPAQPAPAQRPPR